MKCNICGEEEARVHLTQLIGEKVVHKIDLCETCAKTHGVNDPTGFSLADLLKQFGKPDHLDER
jgi:protein arginine kinase activator